jgi:two-component system chemotaxis response regulator CheY
MGADPSAEVPLRFLIVDDSAAARATIRRAIELAGFTGHTFVEAANGPEALKIILQTPPDFVLCDWYMSPLNGLRVLQTARAQGSRVRFGFVSSDTSAETQQAAMTAGADFFLGKPYTPVELRAAFEKAGFQPTQSS